MNIKKRETTHRPAPTSQANMVTVSRRIVPNPDGTAGLEVQLLLDGAPTPERRYFAEFGWVELDRDFVRLSFGQRRFQGGARSVVAIMMSTESVQRLLRALDDFLPRCVVFMDAHHVERRPLEHLESDPEQVVVLTANLFAIAQAGREACFDFYHASAWELRATANAGSVAVDPIVRIDAPTSVLVPVLEALVAMKNQLPEAL